MRLDHTEPARTALNRAGVVTASLGIAVLAIGFLVGTAWAASDEVTAGRIPDTAIRADGSTDLALVPDLITTLDRAGREVGFVRKSDLFPETGVGSLQSGPIAVTDRHGTLVGHMVPEVGYVPLGGAVSETDKVKVETYLIPAPGR